MCSKLSLLTFRCLCLVQHMLPNAKAIDLRVTKEFYCTKDSIEGLANLASNNIGWVVSGLCKVGEVKDRSLYDQSASALIAEIPSVVDTDNFDCNYTQLCPSGQIFLSESCPKNNANSINLA